MSEETTNKDVEVIEDEVEPELQGETDFKWPEHYDNYLCDGVYLELDD